MTPRDAAVTAGVPPSHAGRTRRKLTFWALLAVAVVALSQFLAAWREWQAAPSLGHVAAVVVLGLGLLAVVGWLGFLLYEVDRAAGRVRHQIGVYEWVIAMRRTGGAGR
jgi:hypothetical protein